jgi:hypothetical protein
MPRRSARGQKLPPQEVELLNSIAMDALIVRVNDLYQAGWSLQSIGEALSPQRPRTTIRSWVLKAPTQPTNGEIVDAPIPSPRIRTDQDGYQKKRVSPGIPQGVYEDIQRLAPLARTFRSRMATTSAPSVANGRLTELCKELNAKGVSVKELAEAAGVTYRAMYKRIKL